MNVKFDDLMPMYEAESDPVTAGNDYPHMSVEELSDNLQFLGLCCELTHFHAHQPHKL